MIRTAITCVFSLALAAILAQPASPQGVRYWSDADLKASAQKMSPKINEQHYALDRLGDWGSHYAASKLSSSGVQSFRRGRLTAPGRCPASKSFG